MIQVFNDLSDNLEQNKRYNSTIDKESFKSILSLVKGLVLNDKSGVVKIKSVETIKRNIADSEKEIERLFQEDITLKAQKADIQEKYQSIKNRNLKNLKALEEILK